MAARRLAISSLLCNDDPSTPPVAGPSQSSSSFVETSRHVTSGLSSLYDRNPHEASPIEYIEHQGHRSSQARQVDVVPLSMQPALHLRRHTPSPSPSARMSPPVPPAATRRSFKEIAFDNYQPQPVSLSAFSASTPAVDMADHNTRRHPPHHDSERSSSSRTSSDYVQYGQHLTSASSEPSYTTQQPRRLSSSELTDRSHSPRYSSSSIHSLINSPSRSPTSLYPSSLRRLSQSSNSDNKAPFSQHDIQSSFSQLPQVSRPTASPVQALSKLVSPVNYSPPASASSASQQSSPPPKQLSRHAIASLLTDSPPISRSSAASLPHILNSPIMSMSPAVPPTPSTAHSMGMEGLEALVQAATQERRRLSGEVFKDEIFAATHLVSASRRASPVVDRAGSSRSSPVTERASAGRVSPILERPISQTRSPYASHHVLHPSPPAKAIPLQSPVQVRASPPVAFASPVGFPVTTKPEVPIVARTHSPPFADDEEPPAKRRRASDGMIPRPPSSSHIREVSFVSPISQRSPKALYPVDLPVKPEPSPTLSNCAMDPLPFTVIPPVEVPDKRTANHINTAGAESRTEMSTESNTRSSPMDVFLLSQPKAIDAVPDVPEKIVEPAVKQEVALQKSAEAKPAPKKKKGESKHLAKDKIDKHPKAIRHEHVPAPHVKTDRKSSLPPAERRQDDDPHDWLMEHYGGVSVSRASSPRLQASDLQGGLGEDEGSKSRSVQPKNDHPRLTANTTNTHALSLSLRKVKEARSGVRSRSATPLAMLEEALDTAGDRHHPSRTDARSSQGYRHSHEQRKKPATPGPDLDLDAELDFVVGASTSGTESMRKREDALDIDVDNELLSLLDDDPEPRRSQPQVHVQVEVLKDTSSAHSRNEHGLPHVGSSKSKHASKNTALSERDSMPPPQAPDIREDAKKTETSAAASMKKKDVASKPVAKKPPAARPKAVKAGTSAKSNIKAPSQAKDGSSTPVPSASSSSLTVPTIGSGGKVKKTSHPGAAPPAGAAARRAVSASVVAAASRSRSASVLPGNDVDKTQKSAIEEREEEKVVDDKLYCICKTQYDEERVMIACDRCDEWYHTQCVSMPDLEVDLVDQFICPICVANNPTLSLKTTYKRRCFSGLQHPHPSSSAACHKPARGAYSKYCSDECGVKYMQTKIRKWGGDKGSLWEAVKVADKREAVVVRCLIDGEPDQKPRNGVSEKEEEDSGVDTRVEVIKPTKARVQREGDRLHLLLSRLADRRVILKKEEDAVLWRDRVVDLAIARAELVGECGWDQRLCFGDDEIVEFGAEVMQSYASSKEEGGSVDAMQVDLIGEWWCRGKKKCDRHAGWQKLRHAESDLEKDLLTANLDRLTNQERELRSRIEDVLREGKTSDRKHASIVSGPLKHVNGHVVPEVNGLSTETNGVKSKLNGVGTDAKKGKKRKADVQ